MVVSLEQKPASCGSHTFVKKTVINLMVFTPFEWVLFYPGPAEPTMNRTKQEDTREGPHDITRLPKPTLCWMSCYKSQ